MISGHEDEVEELYSKRQREEDIKRILECNKKLNSELKPEEYLDDSV